MKLHRDGDLQPEPETPIPEMEQTDSDGVRTSVWKGDSDKRSPLEL